MIAIATLVVHDTVQCTFATITAAGSAFSGANGTDGKKQKECNQQNQKDIGNIHKHEASTPVFFRKAGQTQPLFQKYVRKL